jgi:hypothetical protein
MLLHCLYVFGFKFVFEFNFVSSFENRKKGFVFPPSLSLPSGPDLLCSPLASAHFRRTALHTVASLLAPPPPPCVADRWDPGVIPFLGSAPSRNPTAPHPGLASRPAPWPWARTPRRPLLGLFNRCHLTSLGSFARSAPEPPPRIS